MGGSPIVVRSVRTSRGKIDYCIYDFINEMKKKPVIWNRMHIDNKNTAIVEKNWISFAATIVPFIEELAEDEQTLIIDEFKMRWYNIRKKIRNNILTLKKGTSTPCHYLRLMEFFLISKKQSLRDLVSEEEIEILKENEIMWRAKAGFPIEDVVSNERPREYNIEENPKAVSSKKVVLETSNNKRSARLQQKRINKNETINETQTAKKKSKDLKIKKTVSVNQAQKLTKKSKNIAKNTNQSIGNISFDPMSFCETTSQPSLDDVSIQNDSQFDYQQQQQSTNIRFQQFAANSGNSLAMQQYNSYDAHQAFFDSIKPTLRTLNDVQKLDFKIQVLKTLKKYKLY